MKSLYITSVDRYSGKTALCLALGKRMIAKGLKVGYLKPLSLQPSRIGGEFVDEDAAFVKQALGLAVIPADLSPVVVTPEFLKKHLTGDNVGDLMPKVRAAAEAAGAGQDILLLEGGGSLREGYVMGLPTPEVAAELGSKVLVVVKYRDEVLLMDDIMAARFRLGESMCGVVINRVPTEAAEFVEDVARLYFEKQGIPIFGVLPEARGLAALTVEELLEVLDAEILTETKTTDAVIENLTVGAMTAEAALSRMRKQRNKAVITGGDRTDIQLAALETSTTCLILTGNLHPSPLIIKQADQMGVPVLLVAENTMEAIESIDRVFGKTRLGQTAKLEQFQHLITEHVDLKRLYDCIGL
ncbi:MAG: phosphotransacetylase family protein [Anaerolineales bacterium]|nr:phosphotransacetylase family protein [Chloroflexota bacterium]MBL6983256.1 phosphotransacetylase family protein [Anaerolineales bacterium]